VSGTIPAAVADSADEASLLIISTGYALPTPPRHVDVAATAGLVENQGTVSAPDTRGLLIEVPMVPGTGGVSVATGRQAEATASTVALNMAFLTKIPAVSDHFFQSRRITAASKVPALPSPASNGNGSQHPGECIVVGEDV